MKNTEKFIQDAILGGFANEPSVDLPDEPNNLVYLSDMEFCRFLLMPSFWQAVGKTRGWRSLDDADWITNGWDGVKPEWQQKLLQFIDHLADGLSIEDALGKL